MQPPLDIPSSFQPLPRSFYDPSAQIVAPLLLGCWLIRNSPAGPSGGKIVETEAYITNDPACHSFPGITARNRVMWEVPGRAYVYLIYGNHFCFNAVCCPEGIAEAVLIRAIEPTLNPDWMQFNRVVKHRKELTNGPGKLCQALNIQREHDGADLCDPKSAIYIASDPEGSPAFVRREKMITTTRIGITKAADLPLRFYLESSPYVSKRIRTIE